MKRRDFVKQKILGTAAIGLGGINLSMAADTASKFSSKKYDFKMNYAPHLGMFKNHAGDDPIAQIEFMAAQGFTAFEDNGMKNRTVELQEAISKTLVKHNMKMGVFVAHEIYWNKPNLTNNDSSLREKFLKEIQESVAVAKRVNAKWVTVVPGHVDLKLKKAYQTANVVETLKRASAILEPHGIVMVLEPLNFRNHPGQFLSESPQAYEICKAVDSPSCKILFDIYHQQIQEGNLIPNIEASWEEIAYFQVGDNPGRNEPTTGEINYRNVFKYIHSKDFKGVIGMEHGNSLEGKKGELAVIDAYKNSDNY
ncbi:MAG: xylose isomerase [Flavobacteriaceae bacterium]|nr:MAG: xylose isomerase [Flavobacteriaceae bacterium]